MSKAIELLPCPFCGGEPTVKVEQDGWTCIICDRHECLGYVETQYFTTLEEAVEAWNTRWEPDATTYHRSTDYKHDPPRCARCNQLIHREWEAIYCPRCGSRLQGEHRQPNKYRFALETIMNDDIRTSRARGLEQMKRDPDDPRHGKTTGYQYGCRCDRCVKAQRDYNQKKKEERKHERPE